MLKGVRFQWRTIAQQCRVRVEQASPLRGQKRVPDAPLFGIRDFEGGDPPARCYSGPAAVEDTAVVVSVGQPSSTSAAAAAAALSKTLIFAGVGLFCFFCSGGGEYKRVSEPDLRTRTTLDYRPQLAVLIARLVRRGEMAKMTSSTYHTYVQYMTKKRYMKPPVFVYYELNNYYQNHRRYVKSRSSLQLLGEVCRRPPPAS